MKLLILNQHYGLDTPATGVLLHQLTTELARRGHEVTVVAGREGDRAGEAQGHATVRVVRVGAMPIGDKSVLRRLLHYGSYFVMALAAGLREPRPDAIVVMSTPPLLSLVLARALAWYHNVPYYYNVQDLYPDIAWAAGTLPRWLANALAAVAVRLEAAAAGVSTVGKTMRKELGRRFSGSITHLPNWTDTEEIRPLPEEHSFRKMWGLEGRFVVLYSGNLGVAHDTPLIAETIELLRNQPIDFLFVVSAASAAALRARIGDNPRVHFRTYQPRATLPALLATADAGLVTVGKGMSRFVVPCKSFGIMAAGKPVIASCDLHDDLYELTHKLGCGVWAPSGDAAALARAILRLRQDPERAAAMGRKARATAEAEYSVQAAAARWEHWLAQEPALAPDADYLKAA